MPIRQLIIYRPFEGLEVKQEVDTLLYNATDVLKAYNKSKNEDKRMDNYLISPDTQEYIKLLHKKDELASGSQKPKYLESRDLEIDAEESQNLKSLDSKDLEISIDKPKVEGVISTRRGKFGGTWMNQHLLVDFMMWLSPEYKYAAIDFILNGQSLANGRNKIKEGYKKMCTAIMNSGSSNYRDEVTMLNVLVSGSPSVGQRARYGEDKIRLMDDLQRANATLINIGLSLEERKTALIKELLK